MIQYFLKFIAAITLIGSIFYALPAQSQDEGVLKVNLLFSHNGCSAGGSGEFAAIFYVPPERHITSLENGLFFLEFETPEGMKFAEPVFPSPVNFEGEQVFKGKTIVTCKFTVSDETAPGKYEINVIYGYQVCSETGNRMCFMPQEISKAVTLNVLPAGLSPIPLHTDIFSAPAISEDTKESASQPDESLEGRFSSALERGSILAFVLVFIAGILTSFTPCVYPVIPITIGYIGGRAEGKRLRGFVLSLFLVLGLAVMMSAAGIIAAATGQMFGSLTQHSIVIIIVALIFAAMGASMLGAFDISLPSAWQSKMRTTKKGFLGAFLVGMFTGLVAAPCVGPVLVALLAWIAQSGNLLMGFLLMFTYALGLGLLFVVIGTFAGALTALPGSGAWMDTVKYVFGIILIGGAVFILKSLIPQGFYLLFWGIFLIITGVFSGGLSLGKTEETKSVKWGRGIGLILITAGILTFIPGFKTVFGLESHQPGLAVSERKAVINWMVNNPNQGFETALKEGKPVLMDFYADWCAACKELEEKSFSDNKLIDEARGWVFIKMDMTRGNDELNAVQTAHKVHGLPTVILFDSKGEEKFRFSGFKPPEYILGLMGKTEAY